jgi:hypothetical protein
MSLSISYERQANVDGLTTSPSNTVLSAFGRLYCRVFHRSISRPVHGKYKCWRCLREYELEW